MAQESMRVMDWRHRQSRGKSMDASGGMAFEVVDKEDKGIFKLMMMIIKIISYFYNSKSDIYY